MCESIANGERRCAASLEPAFKKAMQSYRDAGETLTPEVMDKLIPAARNYASTLTGMKVINELMFQETQKLLEGEWKDFKFPILNPVRSNGSVRDTFVFNDAQVYLKKHDPFISLLDNAIEAGSRLSNDQTRREIEISRIREEQLESLKKKPLLPRESEHSTAYSILEKAISDGAEIVAPVGSIAFRLTYSEHDYDGANNEFIGVYHSAEDAMRAAVKHVFDRLAVDESWNYFEQIDSPWGAPSVMGIEEWDKARINWFKSTSIDEVLEWSSNGMSSDVKGISGTFSSTEYNIIPLKIEAVGEPYTQRVHIE